MQLPAPRNKGGRPVGSVGKPTRMARERATALAAQGKTPLDEMLSNQWFYSDTARELGKVIEQSIASIQALNKELDKQDLPAEQKKVRQAELIELTKEFNKTAKDFITARDKAQQCAVEAAPYVHPRFQSIEFRGNLDVRAAPEKDITTIKDAADAYADTVRAPANVDAPYCPPKFTVVSNDDSDTVAA